jgi:hypothetical protein
VEYSGMENIGMEFSGIYWNLVEYSGMEFSGI